MSRTIKSNETIGTLLLEQYLLQPKMEILHMELMRCKWDLKHIIFNGRKRSKVLGKGRL